jgi:hypothetical protein
MFLQQTTHCTHHRRFLRKSVDTCGAIRLYICRAGKKTENKTEDLKKSGMVFE